MTTPPEGEPSNLDWVTSLRADSEAAWAPIRQRVRRSLVVYLRRNRPAGFAEGEVEALVEDAVLDTLITVRGKLDTSRYESRFTESGWNLHKADEIGIDSYQDDRSPDRAYRAPLLDSSPQPGRQYPMDPARMPPAPHSFAPDSQPLGRAR